MNAEKFLENEIPYGVRQKLIGTLSRAYADTENLKLSDSAFNSNKGNETLTYIRNLKVEEQIKNEIESYFCRLNIKNVKIMQKIVRTMNLKQRMLLLQFLEFKKRI